MKVRVIVELEYEPKPEDYTREGEIDPPSGLELAHRVLRRDGTLGALPRLVEGLYPGEMHTNVFNLQGECIAARSISLESGY